MRATGIRWQHPSKDVKLATHQLEDLCRDIVHEATKVGFKTAAHPLTGSAIKIGLHMSSFRIDTTKLGHNARLGRYIKSPKGYKRTDVPTWEQRVEFNDLVNDVFDEYGLVALIKSGCYTVRDKRRGRWNETDWENQTPSWMGYHGEVLNGLGESMARILTEKEAREECGSDRLETAHKKQKALVRKAAKGTHLRLVGAA
jgi:hypothetical protein